MWWCRPIDRVYNKLFKFSKILMIFILFSNNLMTKNALARTQPKPKTFNNTGREQEMMKKLGPSRPHSQKPLDAVWQPVADTKEEFHVYSAYLDRRLKPPAVRVIAATRTIEADGVFCRLWLKNFKAYILQAEVKPHEEHHNKYHSAVFVTCQLNFLDPDDVVGGEVAIVSLTEPEKLATNLLKVIDTTPKQRSNKTILHICVRPFHAAYDEIEWMVEWIEFNRMLGVSHFYFYDMSVSERFECLLRKYQNHGELISFLSFDIPVPDLWMEGQLASSHDCLYRSMSTADWLLLIDVDELVLPHNAGIQLLAQNKGSRSLQPLPAIFDILSADADKNDQYSLVFRNAFFYHGWEDDPKSPTHLVTSRKTRRVRIMNWYGDRSKYAVRPSQVFMLAVHSVLQFQFHNDSYSIYVSSQVALLHHYRKDPYGIFPLKIYPSVVDRAAHRWANRLWTRVQERLKDVNIVCPV